MILARKTNTSTLTVLGTAALAVWGVVQHLLERAGRSTDTTDFGLGVLFGVGAGLLILAAWRIGRNRGASAR